jgi:hypothetical protein
VDAAAAAADTLPESSRNVLRVMLLDIWMTMKICADRTAGETDLRSKNP